jgi:alkanesulfonate monooxygenase SsuD/methylene tetrahydromethanopterin reductase-like flavin-dependent oxidoreductase (luciferase family)
MTARKQIILAAYFPGVNNTTVWSDPASKSQIEFESFEYLAKAAERGKLDFFFLAEGLRLREQGGRIHDLDTVGRPDTLTVLTAWPASPPTSAWPAPSTSRSRAHELARQLATLDLLSDGRAAWNVVTSSDASRRELPPGRVPRPRRPLQRAGEFIAVCRQLWDSWAADGWWPIPRRHVRAPRRPAPSSTTGRSSTSTELQRAPSPQGHPSSCRRATRRGRSWRRRRPTPSSPGLDAAGAQAFYADAKDRLAKYGRSATS